MVVLHREAVEVQKVAVDQVAQKLAAAAVVGLRGVEVRVGQAAAVVDLSRAVKVVPKSLSRTIRP